VQTVPFGAEQVVQNRFLELFLFIYFFKQLPAALGNDTDTSSEPKLSRATKD